MKIQLTENQYNSLDRIARKTGMDCWFLIRQKDGEDYVFDLEKGRKISWESALNDFNDGIVDDREFYGLSNKDVAELAELFSKFGLKLCIQSNDSLPILKIRKDVTVEVCVSYNDVFDWISRCSDIDILRNIGKYALSCARDLAEPDDDDFRSRA